AHRVDRPLPPRDGAAVPLPRRTARIHPRRPTRQQGEGIVSNALKVTAPEGLSFVDFEREFDAPVEAVFAAHRDPALVAKWMGPDGYEADMTEWDFRSGGNWSYVHRDPEGNE